MARAAGKRIKKKASKKRGKRGPAPRTKAKRPTRSQGTARRGGHVLIKRGWVYGTSEGVFYNPLAYALSPFGTTGPVPLKFLPELVALQLKAIQYFGIGAELGEPNAALPSREALKLFFAHCRLSDGLPPGITCIRKPLHKGFSHAPFKAEEVLMLGTILIVVLILLVLGALPTWPYSSGWGYYPSGGLGLILLIIIVMLLFGRL